MRTQGVYGCWESSRRNVAADGFGLLRAWKNPKVTTSPHGARSHPRTTAPGPRRTAWLWYLGAWLTLWLLYLATAVGNRSETDDAFAFALIVERATGSALVGSEHLPHLLFLPIWRGLHDGVGLLLPDVSAYDVLRFVNSAAAAAAAVWFVALLHKRFETSLRAAVLAGTGLAASYGFWRYANESDAYPIAAVLAVAYCWVVLKPDIGPALAACAAVVGVIGALFHILLVIPFLVVGPVVFASGRRWRCLGAYAITGAVLLLVSLGTLYAIGRAAGQSFPEYVRGAGEASLALSSIARAPVGLGPNFIAINAAFAYEPFVDRLIDLAPTMELTEERFAAERAPRLSQLAPLTFVAVVALGLVLLVQAVPRWIWVPSSRLLAVFLWALGLALVIVARSPLTPEAWLPLLIPAWILIGVCILDRVQGRAIGVAIAFVLLFAVHNLISGMLVMRSPHNDLGARRAAWLVANAEEGDVILVAEGSTFERYLAYRTSAEVVPLRYLDSSELRRRYNAIGDSVGDVYATEGVFLTKSEYCAQSQALCEDLQDFGAEIRSDFVPIELPPPQQVFRRR
jgi:hypothetical protein